MLLSKYKMKHRDPNLFYLTMDISVSRSGVPLPLRRTLVLEDDARPAELKSCHPWGECRFTLQTRSGGLVRIHDSVLMAESKYKCLLIAEKTTVEDVIRILLNCYGLERIERVERFAIYEQSQTSRRYERRLHAKDRPAQVQSLWPNNEQFHFVLRRAEIASASVSPVSSDVEAMDVSYSSSASSSSSSSSGYSPSPLPPKAEVSLNFRLNGAVSIHQSGLPPPPALRPKPVTQSLSLVNNVKPQHGNNNSIVTFHDYENYFYI